MSRRTKYDTNLFLLIFSILDESYSCAEALRTSNIKMNVEHLRVKYKQYKMHGIEALVPKKNNNSYSETFKESVVQEHLTQGASSNYLAIKYNIPVHSTVEIWIKRYTLGKENVSFSPLSEVYL